jgi:hypothetical protein
VSFGPLSTSPLLDSLEKAGLVAEVTQPLDSPLAGATGPLANNANSALALDLHGGGGGDGESFLRVHWVAVPKAMRARRINSRRRDRLPGQHADHGPHPLPHHGHPATHGCVPGIPRDAPRLASLEMPRD